VLLKQHGHMPTPLRAGAYDSVDWDSCAHIDS
jgi:hypothetical protein